MAVMVSGAGRPARPVQGKARAVRLGAVFVVLVMLLGGCGTPVSVKRANPETVHRELTANVLSTGELSQFTENVLRQRGLDELANKDSSAAIAELHQDVVQGSMRADDLFALAELSFQYAETGAGQPYYLASAVYAYAFLFPEQSDQRASRYDPRFRWGADIYNRAITVAFESGENGYFDPRAGTFELPFGWLYVQFNPDDLLWDDRRLVDFVPAAELEIHGLRNRYRQAGIGAPLAAGTEPLHAQTGFQVARRVKVPVTALLRLPSARQDLAGGRVRGVLELHPATESATVQVGRQTVPLEAEPSAALAYGLSDPAIWQTELQGFLLGDLLRNAPTQLAALQPYQPGRFPVVFVHGTASSAGRWADMVNDLLSDPAISSRFQFWFFTYETGNPIPYSALKLRDALTDAVTALDPHGRDAALHDMVVIGHSQGGLLTKMTVVDSGDRLWSQLSSKPLEELQMRPETRDLLRRALFVKPLPFVHRVVFICTPHRGSYLAQWSIGQMVARLVRLPLNIVGAVGDVVTRNPDAMRVDPRRSGSLYGMTPGSPFITGLSAIPVAPGVAAHSIVAVKGDGPVEQGTDGVVAYSSAHIEGVESERVVHSGHSTQSNPDTIAEVRRILLLHAREACDQQGTGCPPTAETAQTREEPASL